MAGPGFNVKFVFENAPELMRTIKELNDSLSKDFAPMVKNFSDSMKDLNKVNHNTVLAIQAEKNGLSVGRNKTIVNSDLMDWASKDSRRMKKLQKMIEDAQQEQLKIIEEENKYKLERLAEMKRENDHSKWMEGYKDRALQFKMDVAMGKYDESRSFKANARGYWAQRLYQNSVDMANGRGALNNLTSSMFSQLLGPTFGSYVGNTIVSGLGKAMRRRANTMEYDKDGNEVGPKYLIGKFSRLITKGGTLSGDGINVAGGGIALLSQIAISAGSALKTFNDKLIESASGLEKLTAQLSVVSGSKSSAFENFEMIKNYAFNSPYTTTETTQTAVLLKQSGVLQSNLDKTIRMLGDLGMGNQERLNRIANNYSQILAAGRANSKDLREFANAGIPIYKALLEYFQNDPDTDIGKTTEAVRKLAEEGKVTSNVITKIFQKLTSEGGTFYGASSTYANTYSGQMTNLKDRLEVARGNVYDFDSRGLANFYKKILKIKIKGYEALVDDEDVIYRNIKKSKDLEEQKVYGALAITNDKRLKGKTIYDDEEFENLTEEEKETAISLSNYREIIDNYTKHASKQRMYEDGRWKKFGKNKDLNEIFNVGYNESFARNYGQTSVDYLSGLYQDSSSFAYKASALSESGNVYMSNSEKYKIKKAIEDRKKHLATINQYEKYKKLFNKSNNKEGLPVDDVLDVESFSQLYEFMTSGFLTGSGEIITPSKNSELFGNSEALQLRTNAGRISSGIRLGFGKFNNLPKDVSSTFENLISSIDNMSLDDSKSIDQVNKYTKEMSNVIEKAKNKKKTTKEEKEFLSQLESLIASIFVGGYTVSEAPVDYAESFKMRSLRGVSGLDAVHGDTVKANIDEILRKQTKSLGSSVLRNKLKNSTLTDLALLGDIRYTGGKNSYGGMAVDYNLMNSINQETFQDMTWTVKNMNSNLHVFADEMKAYSSEIRTQIDLWTQLEDTLQLGEDKLESAFYDLNDSQRASITAYGKVKTKDGQEYSDLEFQNGTLYANIKQGDKDNWVSVFGKDSELTLVMDDLAKEIADSKTDLLLLESRIKENTIVLTKINNIRDQSNNRRFGNILKNSNYFSSKGFVADKGSDFFNDFNSIFASLYSEYMSLNLPDLSDQEHKDEIAKLYMGGKYSYGQLQNIRALQTGAPYNDDKWIMDQLEVILGDNFKLLIDELKKSQKTYDDNVGWKNLLASSLGLSYETIKNNGASGSVGIYGKLQSRDILRSTMIGLGQSGHAMGDMSNLGVKLEDGTYSWNRTRANLIGKAMNGEFNLETLNGLKSGLEASRNSIIELQATLLTATETTSENNKAITDVLSTMFSGTKLKGKIGDTLVELEQKDNGDGTFKYVKKGTDEVVDTLSKDFTWEQEATSKALQELSDITNATLNTVNIIETMKSSLESIKDDTRDLRIKNTFSSNPAYSYNFRGGNPYEGTASASTYKEYFNEAYNGARSNFINTALEIAKMDIKSDDIKATLDKFNSENKTSFKTDDIKSIFENAQKLKSALDGGKSAEEIMEILTDLGFDQFTAMSLAMSYAKQGVISDRISGYQSLKTKFQGSGDYVPSTSKRIMSRYFGEDVDTAVLKWAQGENSTTENLTEEMIESARQQLMDAFGKDKLISVQDGLSKAFDTFVVDNLTNSLSELGTVLISSSKSWDSLGKSFVNTVKSMTSNMGTLMTTAGLELLIGSGGTMYVPALALMAAGGVSSFVSGLLDTSSANSNDEKIKKLESIKNDLKDLLAQAKADAIYYEKELSNKQSLTTTNSVVKVNDAVITPSGKIVSTHPDDYLIATKTPQTLGGSSPVVNLNIVNNSGQQLGIRQTTSSKNGEINIEAVIEGVVNKGLANGSFDTGMTARDQRLAGRRVYM